ncbi:MAG: AbgT family transporter [Neisseriaceae bacterium]|nr:AbgT family transporter [Neisseriaceae bacterium]
MERLLNHIERIGNKLPHPFILFIILALFVIVISAGLSALGASATHPKTDAVVYVNNLLSAAGIRFMLEEMVNNYMRFPPLGMIIVSLFGIGLADKVGFLPVLIKTSVTKAPKSIVTFIVFVVGISGSIASDAVFIILPPLVAMIYHSLGRHPIAGAAAAYAGASAGYDASLFITPTDAVLSGITTEAARLLNPDAYVSPLDNYFFTLSSVLILATVGTLLIDKFIEPRLNRTLKIDDSPMAQTTFTAVTPAEIKAMKHTGLMALAYVALVILALLPSQSPLRNDDGGLIPSTFSRAFIPILFGFFMTIGISYGRRIGTIKQLRDIPAYMAEAIKALAPTLVLFFVIAQFLAYFRWSNLGQLIAINGSIFLEHTGFQGYPLILSFILLSASMNIFMTSGSAQWSLMAPIFVPMLMLLDYNPAFVLAMYRIGDSTTNIISPMSAYFAVVLVFMQNYKKDMGIGSLLSIMLPISLSFLLIWSAFLCLWVLLGLPLGPGVYMMTN